jgi:hypothetical protein
MTHTKLIFLLGLIITLSLFSCKEDLGINSFQDDQIIPTKAGNQWIYDQTEFDSIGITTRRINDTVRISLDSVASGEQWYKLTGSVGYEFQIFNRPNGYYFYFGGVTTLLYKYPVVINERYRTAISTANDTMIVASLNDNVATPFGNISCYRYDRYVPGRASIRQSVWIEPGKGIIKEEIYRPNNVLQSKVVILTRDLK